MNQSKSFVRKVVYIAIIGGLLIPLSLVSRPATRDQTNQIKDPGGVLSALRDEHRLSQARISEIDPGSETLKLVSLGMRGLAVNLLWMKAIDAKEKKQWDTFSSTLNSLVKIQPNFIKVWEYQGHNLSYNVAIEFDDYEQRYRWVKKGIEFLTTGIPYNRRDHRIIDNLGHFCGYKIGNADEKLQYRSLFRNDDAFHDSMSRFVEIGNIDTPFGPDHWLLGHEWYERSILMVEKGVDETGPVERRRKEMLFYEKPASQLRNMLLSLHPEFRSDEYMQGMWKRAHEEWVEFGNRPLQAIDRPSRTEQWARGRQTQIDVTLESLMQSLTNVQDLRRRLDELVPGVRKNILEQRITQMPETELSLLERPIDSLNDEELSIARRAENVLYGADAGIDQAIARQASKDQEEEVRAILRQLAEENIKIRVRDYFRGTVNYDHWKLQTLAESTDAGILARQAQFDALELRDQSVFDEYLERNQVTGEQRVLPGSIQKFDEAFETWAGIVKDQPRLRNGPMFDDITFQIEKYMVVREVAGEEAWPNNFVLQDVIDYRATLPATSGGDELPTTEELEESRIGAAKERTYRMPTRPNIEFTYESEDDTDEDE